jgi:hypothetical protein
VYLFDGGQYEAFGFDFSIYGTHFTCDGFARIARAGGSAQYQANNGGHFNCQWVCCKRDSVSPKALQKPSHSKKNN